MGRASVEWLPTAERVRLPLRRVDGARLEILLGRLPTGAYQLATSAIVPGHGGSGRVLADDLVLPNRCNAILFGIQELRRQWSHVPAIVADLDELKEDWSL